MGTAAAIRATAGTDAASGRSRSAHAALPAHAVAAFAADGQGQRSDAALTVSVGATALGVALLGVDALVAHTSIERAGVVVVALGRGGAGDTPQLRIASRTRRWARAVVGLI